MQQNTNDHFSPIVAPYHTKFFDVIIIPCPPSISEFDEAIKRIPSRDMNSIMSYEDEILDAIDDLQDLHGSSLLSIKKCIHAKFYSTPSSRDTSVLISTENPVSKVIWRDNLFVQAIKSLVDKHCIDHCTLIRNGSTVYKLSQDFKRKRAYDLLHRQEQREAYRVKQREKKNAIGKKEQKHAVVSAHKPALKKRDLVEPRSVAIVDEGTRARINSMDLVRDCQKAKRSALPHQLGLHADENLNEKKSLREKMKIPRSRILVKEIINKKL